MNSNNSPVLRGSSLLFALCTLMLIPAVVFATDGYVQVNAASLRSAPKPWASLLSTLTYGKKVTVQERHGAWLKVKSASGKEGFIHKSALTMKTVVLTGTKPSFEGSAQSSDLVLAGKGYTKEIEEQFRKGNVPLNYAAVDTIERRPLGEESLFTFRKEGGLD